MARQRREIQWRVPARAGSARICATSSQTDAGKTAWGFCGVDGTKSMDKPWDLTGISMHETWAFMICWGNRWKTVFAFLTIKSTGFDAGVPAYVPLKNTGTKCWFKMHFWIFPITFAGNLKQHSLTPAVKIHALGHPSWPPGLKSPPSMEPHQNYHCDVATLP